jgi:hypothetical protein
LKSACLRTRIRYPKVFEKGRAGKTFFKKFSPAYFFHLFKKAKRPAKKPDAPQKQEG